MKAFYFLFLVAFTGAAALLAYENQSEISLRIFGETYATSISKLVGASYLAGMLSGWTVVGILRRSINRVTSGPLPGEKVELR